MDQFIQKYRKKVTGVLSGFDRLVLKGTIRFLYGMSVLLKDFGEYVQKTTEKLRVASYEAAQLLDRPNIYLQSSKTSKELLAKKIMHKDNITDGLICLLRCVEPCISYDIRRDRSTKKLILEPKQRRCLHIYHCWVDPIFGFMSARIQTWFPCTIYICLNGREWLVSDIMFKSPQALSEIYSQLVQGAMSIFSAPDVMRFLGRKPHGNFQGEVISDYKKRTEGIRVKHRVGANSVKMYDKGRKNLRLEQTSRDVLRFLRPLMNVMPMLWLPLPFTRK